VAVPEPTTEPYAGRGTPAPWDEARRYLADADGYWLATIRPDGRPHVVPVLAVWACDALHLAASRGSRKARNLARDPRCVVTARHDGLDLVVEGEARPVRDHHRARAVATGYAVKYDWQVTVAGATLDGAGAPTAGPPPYTVYEVVPSLVLGLPLSEELTPTRWRFGPLPSRRADGCVGLTRS
jgi:hypothetical protein